MSKKAFQNGAPALATALAASAVPASAVTASATASSASSASATTAADVTAVEETNTLFFTAHVDGIWPKKTNELCAYDLQPFSSFPVGIPRMYHIRSCKYGMEGYFCSWSCAKAFLVRQCYELPECVRRQRLELFNKFVESVLQKPSRLIKLPPPLAYLAKLGSSPSAVAQWRAESSVYGECRAIAEVFMPVVQIYELRDQIERKQLEQMYKAEQQKREPRSIVETREGQRQQMKLVRSATASAGASRGLNTSDPSAAPIYSMLGITSVKKQKV